jgi:MoaA/NifB/PqqE/SkfB family radical SAM enzyme
MKWTILYRGPLSSCNYACDYCPFAKTRNTRAELADDAAKLARFVDWVEKRREKIGVLFTPWGEALIHRHYQEAITTLSHLPNVWRVAIQTNLSCDLDWIDQCDKSVAAFWTTYHPSQISLRRFVEQCARLDAFGARYSVGVVGLREHFAAIGKLRAALRPETYIWVNAYKRTADYYTTEEIEDLRAVDHLFDWNRVAHPSLGRGCHAGQSVFTVDGNGDVRRCHFIKEIIGNIYEPGFENALTPRPCTNNSCGCYIGYVHMPHLRLDEVYGDGLLERVPASTKAHARTCPEALAR